MYFEPVSSDPSSWKISAGMTSSQSCLGQVAKRHVGPSSTLKRKYDAQQSPQKAWPQCREGSAVLDGAMQMGQEGIDEAGVGAGRDGDLILFFATLTAFVTPAFADALASSW